MAIFRVKHEKNYTAMSNYHLQDGRLTLKAKGLLSQILSLPDDWEYSIAGLAYINREGVKAQYARQSTNWNRSAISSGTRNAMLPGKSSARSTPSMNSQCAKTRRWIFHQWIIHRWTSRQRKTARN